MSKAMKIVLIVVLVLVLACGGVVVYLMRSMQKDAAKTVEAPEGFMTGTEDIDQLETLPEETEAPETEPEIVTVEDESNGAGSTPMPIYEASVISDDVTSILLVGADSRTAPDAAEGRSDTMMVISYNRPENTVFVTSFMRDAQVMRIGERSKFKGKLNAAYNGGVGELINTLNLNFDLGLQRYMSVGFEGFWVLVDGIGGVELKTTKEEAYFANWRSADLLKADDKRKYKDILTQMNKDILKDDEDCTQVLRGEKMLWYCRDRYSDFVKEDGTVIGGGDAARIARQQYAITQMYKQITENIDWKALIGIYQYASQYVSTNMSLDEIVELGAAVYNNKPEFKFIRVPEKYTQAKDADGNETTMLAFNLKTTKAELHETIYGSLVTPSPEPTTK